MTLSKKKRSSLHDMAAPSRESCPRRIRGKTKSIRPSLASANLENKVKVTLEEILSAREEGRKY
jgi:hypothetical protein